MSHSFNRKKKQVLKARGCHIGEIMGFLKKSKLMLYKKTKTCPCLNSGFDRIWPCSHK